MEANPEELQRLLDHQQDLRPNPNANAHGGANHSNGAAAVRRNVLYNLQRDIRRARLNLIISSVFEIPQVIAVVAVLAAHYGETCDAPLALWCIIYASRLFLQFVLRLMAVAFRTDRVVNCYLDMQEPLNLVSFVFFVVGNIWILDRDTDCPAEAPHQYQLALTLLIIEYVVWFMPCLAMIVLVPAVCLCLPQLLEALAWLDQYLTPPAVTTEDLASMPTQEYRPGMFPEDWSTDCSICLSSFEAGQRIKSLPCHASHTFHQECLDKWLQHKTTCPLCQTPVPIGADAELAMQNRV